MEEVRSHVGRRSMVDSRSPILDGRCRVVAQRLTVDDGSDVGGHKVRGGVRGGEAEAWERRRMEGARLLREGVWQSEVARRVGVHRQSVSRWAQAIRRGGVWSLKARRVGRHPRLHGEQWKRVEKQLRRDAGAGRRGWTLRRVSGLIERECRVRYCESGAWRMLGRMGWTWRGGGRGWRQRPEVRGGRSEVRGVKGKSDSRST